MHPGPTALEIDEDVVISEDAGRGPADPAGNAGQFVHFRMQGSAKGVGRGAGGDEAASMVALAVDICSGPGTANPDDELAPWPLIVAADLTTIDRPAGGVADAEPTVEGGHSAAGSKSMRGGT